MKTLKLFALDLFALSAAVSSAHNMRRVALMALAYAICLVGFSQPAAPVATAATNVKSAQFTATWQAVAGATGYRLDVSLDNFVNSLVNNKNVDTDLSYKYPGGYAPGTTYKYRVRAVNGSGTSGNSNVIEVTTDLIDYAKMLDVSFGTGGKVTTTIGDQDFITSIAIQSDGKIVAAGVAKIANVQKFALVRYNTDGSFDNTFGTGGIVTTSIPGSGADGAGAVAIQGDGKILAAGFTFNTTMDFALIRYNTNGTLDNTFSSDGIVTTPIGAGNEGPSAMAIQADGKIILAGSASGTVSSFGLARYNTDGSLDNTFDTDGILTTAFGTTASGIGAIALQTDGKIVAAGNGGTGGHNHAMARYNTDGSLDNTFDTDGKLTSAVGSDKGVALQSDGKIVVTVVAPNNVFGLVRYTTAGTLDNTFGAAGIVTTPMDGDAEPKTLVLQPDGKIIVAGSSYTGTSFGDFALARYLTNGSLDNTFGNGGKLYTDMGTGTNGIFSIALQADGKIVAGGIFNASATSDFALARYDTQAGPDTTAPTVAITSITSDATNVSPIPVTFTFSEAVTGFDATDITVANGTAGTVVGSGAVYTSNVTPTSQGVVTISVAASKATDAAANGNTASSNFTRTYDNVVPTVVISSTATNPTNVSPIPVTITFSEPVINFVLGDITVTNGTASTLNSSGAAYAVSVTPTNAGTVTVSVDASKANDAAGNNNTASNLFTTVYQIGKLDQTINFPTIPDKTMGEAPFVVQATATSALAVSFTETSDKITMSGINVTMVSAGRAIITANQAGNTLFNAAPPVDKSFCINPPQPTITSSGANTETAILTSSATTGNQWFKNGAAITGATNATYTIAAEGIYRVQVKVDDCLSKLSAEVPVIVTGDLISHGQRISIFPNPVAEYFEVAGLKGEVGTSLIYDLTGRSHSIELEKRNEVYRGNVPHLVQGVYLLRVQHGNTIKQIKFIKK